MSKLAHTAAAEIIRLHGEIVESYQTTLAKAVRIGELLTEQKQRLGHGKFLPWVAKNLPFTDRTARNYMRVFQDKDQLETAKVESLGQAYKLLSGPEAKSETLSDLAGDAPRDPNPLEDWRAAWREAGASFPAATGPELRQWMQGISLFKSLVAELPDEADDFWRELLLDLLVKPAAGYHLRTGKRLAPSPSLLRASPNRDWLAYHNEIAYWWLRVVAEVGRFLEWCSQVGITLEGNRFHFPEKPQYAAIKNSLHSELKLAARDQQKWKKLSDRKLAEKFGVPEADLPDALEKWMYGQFFLFLSTEDELNEMLAEMWA